MNRGGSGRLQARIPTDDDLTHYQKVVVALNETIRIMKEIDEVIEAHGGWPGAFQMGQRDESDQGLSSAL